MRYGSEAQKQQWLAPLARGEMLGAFCLTEPHVGSDASALRTTATRDGSDYVINGVKQFITSGKNGDVAIVIEIGRAHVELQSPCNLVCRLLLEKKKKNCPSRTRRHRPALGLHRRRVVRAPQRTTR